MSHPTPEATAPADRVPFSQKLGMGIGSIHDMWGHWLYVGLAYQVFNIYLGVSPAWIGRALLFKLVFEAVWDSIFGWWSDNTRTRFGRRRPFILVGSVLAGVTLPMLFAAKPGWSEVEYFWFMVASLAVFVPVMSCFYMPFSSLGSELTPDYHERTSVAAFRSACQKIPEVAMFAAAAFTTAGVWVAATWSDAPRRFVALLDQTFTWFGSVLGALLSLDFSRVGTLMQTLFGWAPAETGAQPNILLGAQVYTVALGVIMIVAGIVMFFLLRERYYEKLVVARHQERVSIKETLWQTLRCRPFRANLSMALAYGSATSLVGTFGYYATVYYVCQGDVAAAGTWNFWMGLSGMFFGFCGIPVYAYAAKRLGKKRGMMIVQFSAMAVFISTWWLYTPEARWLQVFASGLIAFTSAGFWMIYSSIFADVMDYDEMETGKRREGAFSACGSWIMKFGMAIGGWISSEVLARTGFDAALGGNQSAETIFTIRFLLAAVPVAGLVLAFIMLARLGLTPQRMAEVRATLEARRGHV
jgi:GPH family glycoside/pentoside/hexuronide:cation symporter